MLKKDSIFTRVFSIVGAVLIAVLALLMPFKVDKKHLVYADTGFNITSTAYRSNFLLLNCAVNQNQRTGNKNDFRVITAYIFVDIVDEVVEDFKQLTFKLYFDWVNPVNNTNSRVLLGQHVIRYSHNQSLLFSPKNAIQSVSGFDSSFRGQYDYTTTTSSSSITGSEYSFYANTVSILSYPDYQFMYYRGANFDFSNIASLTYGHYEWQDVDSRFGLSTSYFNNNRNMATLWFYQFRYIDNSNNEFLFILPAGRETNFDRTSYFSNTSADSYNSGYNAGYNQGLQENQSSIYNDGYTAGDTAGYNRGYNEGVNDANTYTFTSLIGSVIDVPVRAFTSLFNFELLGVNLSAFFSSLLAVAVIITIVKIVI